MGWTTTQQGYKILQLDSDQATQGFSGAPVFDENLDVVVGMIQEGIRNDEIGRPSFALPIELIKKVFPDLPIVDHNIHHRKNFAVPVLLPYRVNRKAQEDELARAYSTYNPQKPLH